MTNAANLMEAIAELLRDTEVAAVTKSEFVNSDHIAMDLMQNYKGDGVQCSKPTSLLLACIALHSRFHS